MKKILVLIGFCGVFTLSLYGQSKGPLIGKNYYIPYLPYYSFPGMAASRGEKGDFNVSIANYFVQDIVAEFHQAGDSFIKERFIDYEGYIFEPTVSYNFKDDFEVGLTGRVHAYYGGIWDSFIENFHSLFGFSNGGREYYPQNDVYINLQLEEGTDLYLTDSLLAVGDTDLFVKWSFYSSKLLDMALFTAVKIPSGSPETLSGSGYMDWGIELLLDFYFSDKFTFYLQNGVILPGQLFADSDDSPFAIYSLQTALEFIVSPFISLLVQFRLNTTPIKEDSVITENISYSIKFDDPMTNILAGFVIKTGEYRFQFDFEEDAFTNSGADLILNFTIGRSFNF